MIGSLDYFTVSFSCGTFSIHKLTLFISVDRHVLYYPCTHTLPHMIFKMLFTNLRYLKCHSRLTSSPTKKNDVISPPPLNFKTSLFTFIVQKAESTLTVGADEPLPSCAFSRLHHTSQDLFRCFSSSTPQSFLKDLAVVVFCTPHLPSVRFSRAASNQTLSHASWKYGHGCCLNAIWLISLTF